MADKSFWNDKKDKKWLENFWYYYGKVIICAVLAIIIIVSSFVSCMKKKDQDLYIYYFGNMYLGGTVAQNTEEVFSKVVDDVDGKDGVNVYVDQLVYSDPINDVSEEVVNDVELQSAIFQKIQIEIIEGDGYLYLMSEYWYDMCVQGNLLDDISKYTGDESPVYGIEISDNELFRSLEFPKGKKLYAGVRALNNNRIGKQEPEAKHNNALKAIEYICQHKDNL